LDVLLLLARFGYLDEGGSTTVECERELVDGGAGRWGNGLEKEGRGVADGSTRRRSSASRYSLTKGIAKGSIGQVPDFAKPVMMVWGSR